MISVIIPVYNTSEYLRGCFDSILSQDYTDWEVILVNDGSTDNSLQICEEYALKDKRFSVFNQENKGVSAARNRGLAAAKGEYICFIDSDDSVKENYLSHLLSLFADSNVRIVASRLFEGNKKTTDLHYIKGKNKVLRSVFDMQKGIRGYIGGKMFCADIIRDNNLCFNEGQILSEDTVFIYDYLCLCDDLCVAGLSGELLYDYTQREQSATCSSSSSDKFNLKLRKIPDAFDSIKDKTEDKSLKKVIELTKVRQLVTIVRSMIRCNYEDKKLIKNDIAYIRKNLFSYIMCDCFPIRKKVEAILICFCPFIFK